MKRALWQAEEQQEQRVLAVPLLEMGEGVLQRLEGQLGLRVRAGQ